MVLRLLPNKRGREGTIPRTLNTEIASFCLLASALISKPQDSGWDFPLLFFFHLFHILAQRGRSGHLTTFCLLLSTWVYVHSSFSVLWFPALPRICPRSPRDLRSQEYTIGTRSSQFFTLQITCSLYGLTDSPSNKERNQELQLQSEVQNNCLFRTGNHSELSHFKHPALFLMKLLCKHQTPAPAQK